MKFIWVIIGFVLIFGAIVVLNLTGVIDFSWQDLTMIGAAIAGPFKLLFDQFGGKDEVDDILDKHKKMREEEETYRKEMDLLIAEKQKKIEQLDKDLEVQDAKLQVVEEKKKRVKEEVKSMSIQETKDAAHDLLGE